MPLIDLDHQVRVTSSRAPRQHLRILILLAVGLLLFSLAGEPNDSLSPSDKATFCPIFALLAGASSTRVAILDADTGEVARIIYCPAG